MNWKQIIIIISTLIVSTLIVWHDLPIEFPGMIMKVLLLFVKLFVVLALAIIVNIFWAGKKKSSEEGK